MTITQIQSNLDAKFWSLDYGDEELSYTCPEDVITDHFANNVLVDEQIKFPIRVYGFNPIPIDNKFYAENAVENLLETLYDDYGSPYSDYNDIMPKEVKEKLVSDIESAISNSDIWACEVVTCIDYTKEDVKELLGEEFPEWL